MRATAGKSIAALAYLALLLWFGWAGVTDRSGDWSTTFLILLWLAWVAGSIAVGVAFARPDALGLPVLAFIMLMSYVGLWPDEVVNEIWLLNLAFELVISVMFVGLGVVVGARRASRRSNRHRRRVH